MNLQDGIYLSEKDIIMIGKALGAFRAAYLTLAEEADILLTDIDSTYMAGASGFYVDPHKSLGVGQIPPSSKEIYQIGKHFTCNGCGYSFEPMITQKITGNSKGDEKQTYHACNI